MSEYKKLVDECEAFIRSGDDQKVSKLLVKLNSAKVPRKWRLPIANIARRTSHITIGLRLLTPVIRTEDKIEKPTPAELSEYAILLQRAGAVTEALSILYTLKPEEVPNVLLLRSFCHFNTWDYDKAIPLLLQYRTQPLDEYQSLVARANWSAALLATDKWKEAEVALLEAVELAKKLKANRLKGNCFELLSQVYLFNDQLESADESLKEAEEVFASVDGIERLLVEKCRAFFRAKQAGSIEPLLKFREKALAYPHPETVREVDLFILMIQFEQDRFNHLYFGTPFTSYRNRIERYTRRTPSTAIYVLGNLDDPRLDVPSGVCGEKEIFQCGSLAHQTFEFLTRDFYRPSSTNRLFAELFPNEYFNIFSSPARVHKALSRTRGIIEEHGLPIELVRQENGFSIEVKPGLSLAIPITHTSVSTYSQRIAKVKSHFDKTEFTAKEVIEVLGLSKSAAQRFLSEARERQDLGHFGSGSRTVYFKVSE